MDSCGGDDPGIGQARITVGQGSLVFRVVNHVHEGIRCGVARDGEIIPAARLRQADFRTVPSSRRHIGVNLILTTAY